MRSQRTHILAPRPEVHMTPSRLVRPFATAAACAIVALPGAGAQSAALPGATPRSAPSPYFSADDALDINTYSIADVTDDGKWIALTQSVRRDGFGVDYRHDGDPTYVHPVALRLWAVDPRTGTRTAVFPDKRAVRGMRWSPDGTQLAMLAWNGDVFEPAIWSRATGKVTTLRLPAGKYVAETSDIRWNGAGTQVVVAVHTTDWRAKARQAFAAITSATVQVQSSTDPFLAWDDVRRAGNRRSIGLVDVKTGAYRELVPESMVANYTLADDGSVVSYTEDLTKKTDYEAGGPDGQIFVRPAAGGAPRALLASTRGAQVVWSEDGKRYAYSKDGRVYVASVTDSAGRLVAGPPEAVKGAPATPADTTAAGRARARIERVAVSRFSAHGDALLVSNGEGQWVIDLGSNTRDLAIAANDSNPAMPRVTFAAWSDDGSKLYFTTASKSKWERAVVRYDRATKKSEQLVKDGRTYGGLRLSKDGSTAFLTVTEGNRPSDVYMANGDLSNMKRLVESNPQLATKHIGPTDLVNYLDADGHQKYAVVHYPADYKKGTAYPTVFIVYEDFFDDTWDVAANVLAANGYVVVKPSVDFDIGYPGEAWVKGVTAAANKLIEMGVADSSKLGVEGTSYGGYATNLLITQTQRFKAAVNISGKVDLISFYTDSPRLGVRNITAAERQQDRIGATLWQQPQKYIAHSAIMFADRITTPLMLITGEQDSNVPALNSREMYYALRRLGKEVVWVNYLNGGHGGGVASAEDFLDEQRRILEWYDTKLKKKTAQKTASN
jgi:dipeptidyl aminopeptidase/acylaminoacyl peptidase